MILARTYWVSSRSALKHFSLISVELEELVGAFANLSLLIELKAAAESVNLVVVSYWGVTLTSLKHLRARIGDPLPLDIVANDLGNDYLLTYVMIKTTNEVHIVTYCRQGWTLTRCWLPFIVARLLDVDSKAFTLLHSLNIGLKAADELVN